MAFIDSLTQKTNLSQGDSLIISDSEDSNKEKRLLASGLFSGQALNVKHFGAKGDGTTDDTTAIQNLLDEGHSIYLPVGNYKLTAALKMRKRGQVIEGENSVYSRIIQATPTENGIEFEMDGANPVRNIQIKNLTIRGAGINVGIASPSTGSGIHLTDPDNVLTLITGANKIEGCLILGWNKGIYAHQNPLLLVSHSQISGCNICCDYSKVDTFVHLHVALTGYGTAGYEYMTEDANTQATLLMRHRREETGAGNTGHGLASTVIGGDCGNCGSVLDMDSGHITWMDSNFESIHGTQFVRMEKSCSLVWDNNRNSTMEDGGGVNSVIRIYSHTSNGVPKLVLRGGFRKELTNWNDVEIVGTDYHNSDVSNYTGATVNLRRIDTLGGTVQSTTPIISNETKSRDWYLQTPQTNTPAHGAGRSGEKRLLLNRDSVENNDNYLIWLKRANGDVIRGSMANDMLRESLASDVTHRGNVGASYTDFDLINPLRKHICSQSGETLRVKVRGRFAANGNSKQIRIMANGSSRYELAATTSNDEGWMLEYEIVKVATTTNVLAVRFSHGTSIQTHVEATFIMNFASSANALNIGIKGAADDDVIIYHSEVEWAKSSTLY